jgi:hypothetical protein
MQACWLIGGIIRYNIISKIDTYNMYCESTFLRGYQFSWFC